MPDGSRSFVSTSPDLDRVAALFREHFGFVRRVLRRCGVPEAELDDAVQEVFLVVHRRIGDFEGRASETTWLYAVAVRVASTLRRSASRERARREKAGAGMHGAGEADPERELSRHEAGALLDRLLAELDGTKRTVFVLAELEGVPVPEIAQIMDANLRTTHSRLRLARKRFNAALERHHAQESGRIRRASLRGLAERSELQRPKASHTRAACAALMVRISEGATPMAISWAPAAAAVSSTGFWIPVALTAGVGVGCLGLVALVTDPPEPPAVAEVQAAPVAARHPSARSPSPAAVVVEEAEPPVSTPIPVVPREPRPKTKPLIRPKPRPSAPKPAPPAVDVSSLEAEIALLEQARTKLRASDPVGALKFLDLHAARHPTGLLRAERETTRVKALCRAGRVAEAERAAGSNAGLQAVVNASCD